MTTASLPPELAVLLTKYHDTLNENTDAFTGHLDPDDHFTVACQLLNTLVDLETRGDETEDMFRAALQRGQPLGKKLHVDKETVADSRARTDASELHECLTAFVLNAEYMLFQFYRQYEIQMNPFLSHWVEVVRDWERTRDRDHDGKQKAQPSATTTTTRSVDLDIFSARVQLVRGILAGEGVKLGGYSPQEFYVHLASTFKSRVVDVGKFEESLEDMEIYDKPARREKEIVQDTSRQQEEDLQTLKDRWISLIIASPKERMPPESVDFIMNRLLGNISIVTPQLIQFATRHLPATVEINFQWTVKLLEFFLGHFQLRADPKLSEARQALMTAITRLPGTIMPMDLITTLLIKGCVEDVPWMVHGFLANALRAIENMGSRTPTSAHTQYLEQYYDENPSGVTPPGAGGMPISITERGRAAQVQAIRLLSVFINSLVTKRLMTVQDLYFEIEEIGVRYIWIPEARGFLGEMRRLSESWV